MKTVYELSEIYQNNKFLYRDLSNFDLSKLPSKTWNGIDLSNINLKETGIKFNPQKIKDKNLEETNLENVDLSYLFNKKTLFGGKKVSYKDWDGVNLKLANLKGTGIKFNPQKIAEKNLEGTNLENIDLSAFSNEQWNDVKLGGANLKGTGIRFNPQTVFAKMINNAILEGVDLSYLPIEAWKDVDIMGANLRETKIRFDPQNLRFNRVRFCNLENVDLSYLPIEAWNGIVLTGANLKGTKIRFDPQKIDQRDLQLTNLEGLDLSFLPPESWKGIDLRKSKLTGAKLKFSADNFGIRNMIYANLNGIDLSYLPKEVWHGQQLYGADLRGTNVKLPPSVFIDENTKLDIEYSNWYVDDKCPFDAYKWYHKNMRLTDIIDYKDYLLDKNVQYGFREDQYRFFEQVGHDYILKNRNEVERLDDLKLLGNGTIWHKKKGSIPHFSIVKKFPVERIDDFNHKTWYRFSKYDIFRSNDEAKENLVNLCLTFGVFENDAEKDKRAQKLINYLTHIPKYLSIDEYNDAAKFDSNMLQKNYQLITQQKYIFKGESIEEEYKDELKTILSRKEFSKIKNGDNMSLRHYVLNNYIQGEETVYSLNEMIDDKEVDSLNSIMQQINHSEVLTANKLHLMCPGLRLHFNSDFYDFLIDNFYEIINNKEYLGVLTDIEVEYSKIKDKYGRAVNIIDCKRYLESIIYTNVESGSESLAIWCKMCGLPQEKFDGYQAIYANTKERKTSSIPSVKEINIRNKVHAEMLDLDDPLNLVIGEPKLTNCCQKLDNVGEQCMIHASTSTNGRIFVVYNEKNELLAQSWAWLNGDVLCFDNIEASAVLEKNKAQYEELVIEAYKEVSRRLIEENEKVMNIYKEKLNQNISLEERQKISDLIQYQTLKRVTVGKGYSDVDVDKYFTSISKERRMPEEKVSYISDSAQQRIILETGQRVITPPDNYKNIPLFIDLKQQQLFTSEETIEEHSHQI